MSRPIQHYIFISYCRKDGDMMRRVAHSLKNAGLNIWTDEELEPGTSDWQLSVEDSIEAANCVVVCLSPAAKISPWVRRETIHAQTHEIPIFPLMIEGNERLSMPMNLNSYQFIDLRSNKFYEGIKTLIQTIIKDRKSQSFNEEQTPNQETVRKQLLDTITQVVSDVTPRTFALVTHAIYIGLWKRSLSEIRQQLNIPETANPRHFFGNYSLTYIQLVERLATEELWKAKPLNTNEAAEIVKEIATFIGEQATLTSQRLGVDLLTGKPV